MTSQRGEAFPIPRSKIANSSRPRRSGKAARAVSRPDAVTRSRSGAAYDWMFRSRATGQITIVQRPNLALAVALTAIVVRTALRPSGFADAASTVLVDVALTVWAAPEIVRGVNPFRRLLGAMVLVFAVVSWVGANT